MAITGTWGPVIFSVSEDRVLTFDKLSRSVSGAWANHGRVGKKVLTEFVRPELQSITMSVVLDATLGVPPRKLLEKLAAAVENGQVDWLVIGGEVVGANRWKLTGVSESWDVFLPGGELVRATVGLTLEEYL